MVADKRIQYISTVVSETDPLYYGSDQHNIIRVDSHDINHLCRSDPDTQAFTKPRGKMRAYFTNVRSTV